MHRHAALGDTIKYWVTSRTGIKEGYHPEVDLMTRAGIECRQTGNIFIENGRFHGERIVNVLVERLRQD